MFYSGEHSDEGLTLLVSRQIKVREAYHSYQLQQNYPDRTPIGEIQLKGHWLIQAGFTIDTPVHIRVMEGCMVLTTDKRPVG
ncbi:SymE family type I addiction module toxin [Motiliproteus sp. MSK22-1]|uniref:SymE family type I addiction module toxin n=1 Tax=Motiliproteus sp. MSK22-1 TaxID=1897630 RepID=UPI0009783F35|nr:SymE family type I addiction module toxin [Motiliproteus sp. MSK22-1]OMH29359.1 hypothetical protein BGP75_19965 [Motiliproteus sp. MSK22-1]